MKTNQLYYGVAYYDEYLPYDRIETDMKMMKEAGINVIRIAESTWSTMEPHEGVFDFTHLNRMLDASEKYGISVIVGTPTYAVPTWLVKIHPDVLAFSHNGQELYGHRQNMDITNPHYLKYSERIIRKMMEEIKDRKHIIGFQLDNETKHYDTCGKNVQARFVSYLQTKYPDINDFNHEFGLDYWSNRINSWEDFPDVRGTINGSLGAEFEKFQRSLVTDFFAWQADIVNEYRRPDQFITHNFDFSWEGISVGLQPAVEQFDAAKCMDVAGCDIYHRSAQDLTGAEFAACGALARAIKQDNYLILETEAQGCFGWLPYPGQLRLQAFSHVSNGANSVMYWHWHSIHNSFETYWKGLLSHDLQPNRLYREAMQIGSEFAKYGNKLKNLKKQNKVAFLMSNRSLTGMDWFPIDEELSYNKIFRWLYDTFYRMNVEADILYDYQDNLEFSNYDLIVLPALYSTERTVLEKLDEYTKNGGHLLVTFKSCFSNENLKVFAEAQPAVLTKALGCTYDEFTKPVGVGLKSNIVKFESIANCGEDACSGDGSGLHSGNVSDDCSKLHSGSASGDGKLYQTGVSNNTPPTVSHFMELIRIPSDSDAEVLATYNHKHWGDYAACTYHNYHEGSAAYIGCYMDTDALEILLAEILDRFGITHSEYTFPIIVKQGINDDGEKVNYFFNYSDDDITVDYLYGNGSNLFDGTCVTNGDAITVHAWDFVVVIER